MRLLSRSAPLLAFALLGATGLGAQTSAEADLLAAARAGDAATLQAALDEGAAPDAPDADGATALMWAAHEGHAEAVRVLLGAGAAVDGAEGAIWMDETRRGYFGSVLGAAIGRGHGALVPLLVEEGGADVDGADWNPHTATRTGWTPLQWAAVLGDAPTVAYLIERGADLERAPGGGATPLALALGGGHTAVADLLRAAGADLAAVQRLPRALAPDGAASDSLTTASDTLASGEFSVFHALRLAEATPFEVAVTATAFDPHLFLRTPSGTMLQNADWRGSPTEARVRVAPTQAEAGMWGVLITSNDVGEVGAYHLAHRTLTAEAHGLLAQQEAPLARADSLFAVADERMSEGHLGEAEPLVREGLAVREQVLGPDHPAVGMSLNTLAFLLNQQGRYAEAVPPAERALAVLEAALGPRHPGLATVLSNLAVLYDTHGRYAEAEALHGRALAIREAALGPEHPDVAASLSNLAALYKTLGRYAEAAALLQRAADVLQRACGPDHPEVARALNGLATVYVSQGRYAEAEPLHRRALAIREAALGPEHPDVAASLRDLAALRYYQGSYEDAEPLYVRALAIQEAALGPDHPDVAATLNNLAVLYKAQGRYPEAEPLYTRALVLAEAAMGPAHPDVALALSNLAGLYQAQGRFAEAEPLYTRALAIDEAALGPEHPETARALNNLAAFLKAQGRYAEAEALYTRALAVLEAALGPDHPDVAVSLSNLAALYQARGRYAEAGSLFARALALHEAAHGADHPDTARSLNNLAGLYEEQARYAEAEPLYTRALVVWEGALGPGHPEVAYSLGNLAGLRVRLGRYAEAEGQYRRALTILESAFGPEHPDVAAAVSNLAAFYETQGRYAEAVDLAERALAIQEATLGPEHPDVATTLNNLAEYYTDLARYAEAEPRYRRALALYTAALGSAHASVALVLGNLAALYEAQGRYAEAVDLAERALAIREAALGSEHPDVATSLNGLASLDQAQGRYPEAEARYRRVVRIYEAAHGPEHPDVALGLNNLAVLYQAQGRYDDALPLVERALALREAALGPDHPDVATSLGNLAALYQTQGRSAEVEPLHRRALAIREAALGPEHPDVASSLNGLVVFLADQGRHAEALPLAERMLAIYEAAYGSEHPDVALGLNNLGALYAWQGRYAEAEPRYRRALALHEAALGPDHPRMALSLNNLAVLDAALGRLDAAAEGLARAVAIESDFIARLLPYATEREQEAFLRTQTPVGRLVTLAFLPEAPVSAAGTAFHHVLQRKALRLDVTAQQQRAALASEDPTAQRLFETLQALARQIAALTFAGPGDGDPDAYRARLDALHERRIAVEDSLARQSGALVQDRRTVPADARAVAAALPPGTPLVEFVRYDTYDFLATGEAPRWGEAHYAAFVLTAGGSGPDVRPVSLGPAAPIDSLIQAFRSQVAAFDPARLGRAQQRQAEARLAATTEALYRALVAPLGLPEAGPLLVAPDGLLHTLPLAVLTDDTGRPLAERYRISYLTSGRDLLRPAPDPAPDAFVVFAGVDYAAALDPAGPPPHETAATGERSRDLQGALFAALPGTDEEAAALLALHPERVRLFLGAEASEANLLALRAPWRLHIATHGFFLSDQGAVARLTGLAGEDGASAPGDLGRFENPLLRSGLALAGANRLAQTEDEATEDGIATAYELTGLDLRGTDLVVLSACETGLGEVEDGEGVLGLRRAFELAGAETVVMSLWKVPDAATMALMGAFYEALEGGAGKAEALRTAAQAVRADPRWSHPYWWGAFVLAGEPG